MKRGISGVSVAGVSPSDAERRCGTASGARPAAAAVRSVFVAVYLAEEVQVRQVTQILQGPFSAVSTPNVATKASFSACFEI